MKKYSTVEVKCFKDSKFCHYEEHYRNITDDELEKELNKMVKVGWYKFEIHYKDADSKSHGRTLILDKEIVVESIRQRNSRNILTVSKCESQCKWFFKSKKGFSCRAFDEIPKQIIDGEVEHDHVIEGQKGNYIFESK